MSPEVKNQVSLTASYTDEAYDAALSGTYQLAVLLGMDGLSYCILDPGKNKYLLLESYSFLNIYNYSSLCDTLGNLVKQSKFLNEKFKRTIVAFDGAKSTLIPAPLFENGDKENFMKFNHTLEGDEITLVDNLKGLGAKNLFAMPKSLQAKIGELFPGAELHHSSSAIIDSLLGKYKNQPGKRAIVHVQASHFEVLVMEGASMLFFNSFRHQTSEDFIYYLLFVCEQLKLNPENIDLVLLGEVEKNSTLYNVVYKYIRNLKFGERPEGFTYSYKLNEAPAHFYYSLLCQAK